jgi:hypothetical protein
MDPALTSKSLSVDVLDSFGSIDCAGMNELFCDSFKDCFDERSKLRIGLRLASNA